MIDLDPQGDTSRNLGFSIPEDDVEDLTDVDKYENEIENLASFFHKKSTLEDIIQKTELPQLDVILLDDGYQHRWINAGLNIILSSFEFPYYKDKILPLGNLREHVENVKRAHIVIISKTPLNTNKEEKKNIDSNLRLKANQCLYFSSIKYKKFKCLITNKEFIPKSNYTITLVSGIANTFHLVNYLENTYTVNHIKFKDHHKYSKKGDYLWHFHSILRV